MPKKEIAESEEKTKFKTTIGMAMSKLKKDVKQLEAELIRIKLIHQKTLTHI